MNDLQEKLHRLSEELAPDNEAFFAGLIAPLLPAEPLSPGFLGETLAPLGGLEQAIVLEFLARLGRAEVAGPAAERLQRGGLTGLEVIDLSVALARCGDPRGLEALEALFLRSHKHPEEKPSSVPLEWILEDALRRRLGTPQALDLRQRLVALYNSARSKTN